MSLLEGQRAFCGAVNWNWRIVQPICIIDAVNPSKHVRWRRIHRKFESYSSERRVANEALRG
jgi:hypothetical protein